MMVARQVHPVLWMWPYAYLQLSHLSRTLPRVVLLLLEHESSDRLPGKAGHPQ